MSDEISQLETALWLEKQWEISIENPVDTDRAMLLRALAERIEKLLSDDMEKLVNLMYRLDVPEHQFHSAMKEGSVGQIAKALAEIVLAREIKRLEYRKKYSS